MNSTFQRAADHNNTGVASLRDGCGDAAITSLTASIKLMRQELAKPNATSKRLKSSSISAQLSGNVRIPKLDTPDAFLYNEAISIPCGGEHSDLDIHVYTAAVIFNLAMAHHFEAIHSNRSFFAKAEKLYAMTLRLLDDEALRIRTAVVVKLAAINNLAQVRLSQGEFEHASRGLVEVNNVVGRADGMVFEEPGVQGLLMHVLMLGAPKVAPAA